VNVVEQDLQESGLRMILNLGHTFGHAIESVTDYNLTHGEAVFLGMRAMLRLSERRGLLDADEAIRIDETLRSVKLPSVDLNPADLLSFIPHDKKTRGGRLNWVLLKGVGEPVITNEVKEQDVFETAAWLCQAASFGAATVRFPRRLRVAIFNGPNLNLLGEREPEIYGRGNYRELEDRTRSFSDSEGIEVVLQQSNSEGELVSLIQFARHWADGLIINAGAYTHTSVAIRDAISAISIPAVEVHMSKIEAREKFRRSSMIREVCIEQISGKGIQGYLDAIIFLRDYLLKVSDSNKQFLNH
jgi:3-dehydroquinate dehydratase-2